MIKKIFSVKDDKSGFDSLFMCENELVAKRDFFVAVSDSNSMFAKFPHDFHLYCVGSFDTVTGEIIPDNIHLCCANDLLGGDVDG